MIKRVIIKNYKGLRNADVEFVRDLNILVGDNETGKSTLLEAINLGLTGQLNRRPAAYELHPFLFNLECTREFLSVLHEGRQAAPPEISVEIFFYDDAKLSELKGTNNSLREDCPGLVLRILLDDAFTAEYSACLTQQERMTMIPIEYYCVQWLGFDGNPIKLQKLPLRPILIDPSALNNLYSANRYVVEIARDLLSPSQQANLALSYRKMRDAFHSDEGVAAINQQLQQETSVVSDKKLSVALDMTAKASWDSSVLPHLDDLPLTQAGKGEQSAVKIKLALRSNPDRQILLIEEPENHLSHTNLNRLIDQIKTHTEGRQLIIATHSSFVLNKLGVEKTLMFNGRRALRISDLPDSTRDYFLKLPGHDTLRMVLAKRTILVEGPSDELIVQKAYQQVHGRLPLEDNVEVISVASLAFARFLDIAQRLNLPTAVVTDNDGDPANVATKYSGYASAANINICYSENADLSTLEPNLVAKNGLEKLNRILGKSFTDEALLTAHMLRNKTSTALALFSSSEAIGIPDYISNAIA